MKEKLKKIYEAVGLPRLLIICFFLAVLLSSGSLELSIPSLLGDTVRRWVMYGLLVLAMVPAVQCGIGLNFGVSLGIVGGLLGATIAIELEFANPWISLLVAMTVGTAIATVFGVGYGLLLNRVKGSEMTVSTYVGFSTIAFMNIVWLSLPYKNGEMIWPLGGAGLRNTINLNSSFGEVLSNTPLSINISQQGITFGEKAAELNAAATGFYIPTVAMLLFLAFCVLMWLFMRSKVGLAMSAAGANPKFAQATGINVNNMRILGTTISTALGGAGIVLYAQSYGFLQLYNAPPDDELPLRGGHPYRRRVHRPGPHLPRSVGHVPVSGPAGRGAAGGEQGPAGGQPFGYHPDHHLLRHHPLRPVQNQARRERRCVILIGP